MVLHQNVQFLPTYVNAALSVSKNGFSAVRAGERSLSDLKEQPPRNMQPLYLRIHFPEAPVLSV